MRIIPVLDIRRGKVVQAVAGNRSKYPLLDSVLSNNTEPAEVIFDLLAWFPFEVIYIADLDAIETGHLESTRYDFLQQFPLQQFWVDSGIAELQDLNCYQRWTNVIPVCGTETIKQTSLIKSLTNSREKILSLDKKQGVLLGQQNPIVFSEYWPQQVIAMSLDMVGTSNGPDVEWLQQLMKLRTDIAWYAAGGVRHKTDLEKLQRLGVEGVLVATALHSGELTLEDMELFASDTAQ